MLAFYDVDTFRGACEFWKCVLAFFFATISAGSGSWCHQSVSQMHAPVGVGTFTLSFQARFFLPRGSDCIAMPTSIFGFRFDACVSQVDKPYFPSDPQGMPQKRFVERLVLDLDLLAPSPTRMACERRQAHLAPSR